MKFREYLKSKIKNGEPIFFDGGMGTVIQKYGSGISYKIPEDLNFYKEDLIKRIHMEYLHSGCNILTTNTFGSLPEKLKGEGMAHTAAEYVAKAVSIARESISEFEKSDKTREHFVVWGTSTNGRLMEPMGNLTFDEAYESYREVAVAAEKAGADFALIETMSDLYEVKAFVLAVRENTNLPIFASMTFQPNLRTLTGADVLTCVTYLESLRVNAIGFNCGGSLEEDKKLLEDFIKYSHIPVFVQPNAGIPEVVDGKDVFNVTPKEFADFQKSSYIKGARILGGCCGTTPEHLATMVAEVDELKDKSFDELLKDVSSKPKSYFDEQNVKNASIVCSCNMSVQVGGTAGPKIIGERINPTGKKKCREALLKDDMQFLISEAESQIKAGAHILDVNVGLPEIDEKQMMKKAVKTLQGVFNVPLQLDSSESDVLESAMRYYNGKPLVNSVNGKQEVMDRVFPLVAKYGGAVVALCIDENGISDTAEGRCWVARKIILEAAKYGIPVRDIFIDTLTLTVSSGQKAALETIRAIRILKEEFGNEGLQFVLGVSNISFGLPRRDIMNSRFFMLALDGGLSAAIINPSTKTMMDTYFAYRALSGFDENCIDFIEKYTDSKDPYVCSSNVLESSSAKKSISESHDSVKDDFSELVSIIENGFKDSSASATEKLLEKYAPVDIIDGCIVKALDSVGKDFEAGRKFLPQLLLSAETVSCSFAVIKKFLEKTGMKSESKGKVVIATVHGDIHDIGKNIVKAMLENYGYEVIDLGKNVPAEKVVEAVVENKARLVGLSALMTTTVASMEKTIKLLREAFAKNNLDCKICVGGAVLTADYAERIGADFYSKDAMQTVACAKEVFGK